MKSVSMIGVVLVLLGLLAFVLPIPHRENHGVKVGDAKIAIQTESSERLPLVVGVMLVAGGILALVVASRQS